MLLNLKLESNTLALCVLLATVYLDSCRDSSQKGATCKTLITAEHQSAFSPVSLIPFHSQKKKICAFFNVSSNAFSTMALGKELFFCCLGSLQVMGWIYHTVLMTACVLNVTPVSLIR